MEIGKPDPPVGQPIQVGRIDLAAERADIGKPEVVRHDHQKVGPLHAEASCQVRRRDETLEVHTEGGNRMLAQFGMSIPLVAAPMSGGPTTPAMVSAATRAGGLGMLAAGYTTVAARAA